MQHPDRPRQHEEELRILTANARTDPEAPKAEAFYSHAEAHLMQISRSSDSILLECSPYSKQTLFFTDRCGHHCSRCNEDDGAFVCTAKLTLNLNGPGYGRDPYKVFALSTCDVADVATVSFRAAWSSSSLAMEAGAPGAAQSAAEALSACSCGAMLPVSQNRLCQGNDVMMIMDDVKSLRGLEFNSCHCCDTHGFADSVKKMKFGELRGVSV